MLELSAVNEQLFRLQSTYAVTLSALLMMAHKDDGITIKNNLDRGEDASYKIFIPFEYLEFISGSEVKIDTVVKDGVTGAMVALLLREEDGEKETTT